MLGSVGKPPPQTYWMPRWAVPKVGLYCDDDDFVVACWRASKCHLVSCALAEPRLNPQGMPA